MNDVLALIAERIAELEDRRLELLDRIKALNAVNAQLARWYNAEADVKARLPKGNAA